ncbi:acyl-CoA N-acyltransferase [Immersiella caudata]|uniref:Acyl-CoA N-acyltransferase n=1 Tax=Immersiella caudata TaxID=314043 RepID=A0AA40BWW9_9PEZI|nr:acyl-CoA N-acyltransferase [Immersiella caudata]
MHEARAKAHLRRATPADAQVLAEIGYRAFNQEPIDGHWFPRKDRYVEDYRRAIFNELTLRLVTPGNVIMVIEIEEDGHAGRSEAEDKNAILATAPGKKVVAYGVFVKNATKPEELTNWSPDTLMQRIRRALVQLQEFVYETLWPNKAVDTETYRIYYEQAHQEYMKYLNDPDTPWIECRGLAVHPDYRRRGYAEKLMNWVGHTAWTEEVQIFADCTDTGLPLYLKAGVEIIGKVTLPAKVVDNGPGYEPLKLEEIHATLIRVKF